MPTTRTVLTFENGQETSFGLLEVAMHFTEERAQELLFTNPPNPGKIHDLIESSWFVNRPYAGILTPVRDAAHGHRYKLHPLYETYMAEKMRESEALYLRSRIRRRFRAIVTLKLFVNRWGRSFVERYYAPGGRGMLKARQHFEESLRRM